MCHNDLGPGGQTWADLGPLARAVSLSRSLARSLSPSHTLALSLSRALPLSLFLSPSLYRARSLRRTLGPDGSIAGLMFMCIIFSVTSSSWSRLQGSGFLVSGFGFRVLDFRFWVSGTGVGCRV